MKILEKKDKKSIPVQTEDGKVYLSFNRSTEGEYLKYAAHLLSEGVPRAVCKDEPNYYFVTRKNNEITVEHKRIEDSGAATFEIDEFFESRETITFDESEVPKVRLSPLSDRRVVFAIIFISLAIACYALYKIAEPKGYIAALSTSPAPKPTSLNDVEKKKLAFIGNKLVVEKISELVTAASPDKQQWVNAMSVQKTDGPQDVSFIITTGKNYHYPEVDTVKISDGIYGKTVTDKISLERKNIHPIETAAFDSCALQMLGKGFDVTARDAVCASMTYEGDAPKLIEIYRTLVDANCNINLKNLSISDHKGKIDVSLCN